jgi:hypothetical protein
MHQKVIIENVGMQTAYCTSFSPIPRREERPASEIGDASASTRAMAGFIVEMYL